MCFLSLQRSAAPCWWVAPDSGGSWWPRGQSKVNAMAFLCPQGTVDKLEKEKMPRKGGRWWFSWRRRDFPAEEVGGYGHRVGPAQAGAGCSLDECLPHSKMPRGRRPRPGSQGGELIFWLGAWEVHPRRAGRSQHLAPAVVHGPCPVTSTPFLFPEECPHFTDGETETWRYTKGPTAEKWQSWEGGPDKGLPHEGWQGLPSPPGACWPCFLFTYEPSQNAQGWVRG